MSPRRFLSGAHRPGFWGRYWGWACIWVPSPLASHKESSRLRTRSASRFALEGERRDSNPRPPGPQPGTHAEPLPPQCRMEAGLARVAVTGWWSRRLSRRGCGSGAVRPPCRRARRRVERRPIRPAPVWERRCPLASARAPGPRPRQQRRRRPGCCSLRRRPALRACAAAARRVLCASDKRPCGDAPLEQAIRRSVPDHVGGSAPGPTAARLPDTRSHARMGPLTSGFLGRPATHSRRLHRTRLDAGSYLPRYAACELSLATEFPAWRRVVRRRVPCAEDALRVDLGPAGGSGEVRGAEIARQAVIYSRLGLVVELALINGAVGVVTRRDGEPFSVTGFTVKGGRIVAMDILADPARLRRLDLTVLDD